MPGVALLLLLALGPTTIAQREGAERARTEESFIVDAVRFANQQQYDKAVDAYREAIRLNPASVIAHLGLGSAYRDMGRPADAVEPLRTAIRLEPQNGAAHLVLGITLAALRRADEALAELIEAKGLLPDSARVHNEIGNVLHNNFGRMEEALAEYQQARTLDPTVPTVHHNIGLMLMRLGRFAEAIDPLNETLRLDPAYRNARYLVSDAYSRSGRYADAVDSWTKFLAMVPNGPEALHNRAWNYMYLGGHGEAAAADARQLLRTQGWRIEPAPFMALVAHIGYRQSALDADARAILEEASTKWPATAWPHPIIRYMLGAVSEEQLLTAADTNDRKTEAHTYLGMDLLLKGQPDEARTHFEWVREYGKKRYLEYPLALAELKRMGY
jgi:tetratricopeptide (TPR) repeat protein